MSGSLWGRLFGRRPAPVHQQFDERTGKLLPPGESITYSTPKPRPEPAPVVFTRTDTMADAHDGGTVTRTVIETLHPDGSWAASVTFSKGRP